jgi:hypothetical protein
MQPKKKLRQASLAPTMGHLCISLKCSRATLVIAYGDARNARQAEPMRKASQPPTIANTSRCWRESPGGLEKRASLTLGFLDGYSFAAIGFPPLLDTYYKLKANDKFRAVHTLAVHDARQRFNALWSGNQHMLPRRADQFRHNACASRTHIFGDRPLIKSGFVQAQKLDRHCPRSALFISASGYLHLALAPCRCPNRMPAELGPKIGKEGVWSLSSASAGKSTTPLSSLLWLPPFGNIENLVSRRDGREQTGQCTAECWALAKAESAAGVSHHCGV